MVVLWSKRTLVCPPGKFESHVVSENLRHVTEKINLGRKVLQRVPIFE